MQINQFDKTSKTIVILHGWGSRSDSWSNVKEILQNQGYNVIVPDLPGFGKSAPLSEIWSVNNYVDWIDNFIKKHNYNNQKIFLLGYSFGGRIAIKFAAKYPERLKGLILCSAAGITPRPKIKIAIFNLLSKIGNLIFSLPFLKVFQRPTRKIIYLLCRNRDYYYLQNETMRQTFKRVIEEDLTSYLSQIKIPSLIIWGEKDKLTPIADAYKMHQQIKDSVLKIIPQGKHSFYLQYPEKLANIIDRECRAIA